MLTFSTSQLNRNEFSRARSTTVHHMKKKKKKRIVYSASRIVYLLLFISTLFILFFSSFNRFSLRHFSFILVFIFFFFLSLCSRILWVCCRQILRSNIFFCLSFVQMVESINVLCAFIGPKMKKKKERRTNLHENFETQVSCVLLAMRLMKNGDG